MAITADDKDSAEQNPPKDSQGDQSPESAPDSTCAKAAAPLSTNLRNKARRYLKPALGVAF